MPAEHEAIQKAVTMLKKAKSVLILTHKSPDGDTLGSAFALCRALKKLGHRARVVCSDPMPERYDYLHEELDTEEFEPDFIVASDIASVNLFGDGLKQYEGMVDLCIDHHPSNTGYAKFTLVDAAAAANCELMADVIDLLNVEIDKNIANCLYTGLATDTGCFRYSSTTPKTLHKAALMVEKGADNAKINKALFETTSRGRLELERMTLQTLEYYYGGKVALIVLSKEMYDKTGVSESECEGIPSLPARIEGVAAGITLKERENSTYKISLRTNSAINASKICSGFGGGGHAAAAGCELNGSLDEVKAAIVKAVGEALPKMEKGV